MPEGCALTNDKVPGRGEHQGAGKCDTVQGEARWSGPQTAVVKQPNEATAQAEVDRSAVRYDTIMTLQRQEFDDHKYSVVEGGFPLWSSTAQYSEHSNEKKRGKYQTANNIYLFLSVVLLFVLQVALHLFLILPK